MPNGNDIDPMEELANQILAESLNLVNLARPFKNKFNRLSLDEKKESLGQLQQKLAHIGDMVRVSIQGMERDASPPAEELVRAIDSRTPTNSKDTTFAKFLSDIGESVIKSQEQLDQRSIQYLQGIQDRPYIPPTMFRIPRITAELKVALEEKEGMGLNVLLFSRKREMSELNQQSINFEIAAVPPSPELLHMLQDQVPRIDFLFDQMKRQAIFELVKALSPQQTNTNLQTQLKVMLSSENQHKVLIWPVKGNNTFLLLFAADATGKDIGVWFLDADKKELSAVLRLDLTPKPSENQAPLREFVFGLGQAQAKLLGVG
ncbi:MAG: hypothetical protein R2828_10220 [Saprospiraceae bacterium]